MESYEEVIRDNGFAELEIVKRPTSLLTKSLAVATGSLLLAGANGAAWLRESNSSHPHDATTTAIESTRIASLPEAIITTSVPATTTPTTIKVRATPRITNKNISRTTTPHTQPLHIRPPVSSSGIHIASQPSIIYGADVSWPEGNCTVPAASLNQANFVIIGVNNGSDGSPTFRTNDSVKFNDNPHPVNCFKYELDAARQVELYVNPGAPITASDMQHAQTGPLKCQNITATPANCAYNFGYNLGQFDDNFIIKYLPELNAKLWNHRLWLDIENCDPACFTNNPITNAAAVYGILAGLPAGFLSYGSMNIGIYSTATIMRSIFGNNFQDPEGAARQTWIATGPGTICNLKTWNASNRVFGTPQFAQYSAYPPGVPPVPDNAGRPLDYDVPIGEIATLVANNHC